MNTQTETFTFAGFQWPRYVANMAQGTAQLRKKWAGRKVCSEYYHAPKPNANTGMGFYLDNAGQPFTRWKWADEAAQINHTGWFCDEYGDGNKIRGIVVSLPHGRFLAGWSMGKGMASTVDADLYDSAESAAYAADSMAERAAETEREYQSNLESEQ